MEEMREGRVDLRDREGLPAHDPLEPPKPEDRLQPCL